MQNRAFQKAGHQLPALGEAAQMGMNPPPIRSSCLPLSASLTRNSRKSLSKSLINAALHLSRASPATSRNPLKGHETPRGPHNHLERTFETNIASLPPPFLPRLHLHLLLLHHLWDWLQLFTWVRVGSGRVQETVKPVIPWPLLLCLGCSACILNFLGLEIP